MRQLLRFATLTVGLLAPPAWSAPPGAPGPTAPAGTAPAGTAPAGTAPAGTAPDRSPPTSVVPRVGLDAAVAPTRAIVSPAATAPDSDASADSTGTPAPQVTPDPAAPSDPSASPDPATAPPPPAAAPKEEVELCQESFSADRERPTIKETFPTRGTSGHVAWLELTLSHAKGEQVFPGGLAFPADAAERKLLRAAEFELPLPDSQLKPTVKRTENGGGATTTVRLPLIALPREAGRHTLTLPRLPIAIARASGKVETLCTGAHRITVEDPLASSSSMSPAEDPEPRPQREIWTAARDLAKALLVALPVALLVAWLLYNFRDRFKKKVIAPPPRPPWEIALAQLDRLQAEQLLQKSEYEAYLDRASDTLREYLGARFGFEGLESTTRELLRQLERRAPDFDHQRAVRQLLQRTDLVKFARQLPDEQECREAFEEVRRLVLVTRLEKPTPSANAAGAAAEPLPRPRAEGGEPR